jgi:hypothetical protein
MTEVFFMVRKNTKALNSRYAKYQSYNRQRVRTLISFGKEIKRVLFKECL